MHTHPGKAALIYRMIDFAVSTAGIILHMQTKHFVQTGFMIRHNLAYFTLQTNIGIALLFAVLIFRTLRSHGKGADWSVAQISPGLHGALTFYITITMLGYWLLLSPTTGNPQNPYLFVSSLILHTITPLLAIGDFFLFCPHGRLTKRHAALWLSYPAAYLLLVMVYSRFIQEPYYSFQLGGKTMDLMYPYPFLDTAVMGPWGVAAAVILLAAIFYGLGLLFITLDKQAARPAKQK